MLTWTIFWQVSDISTDVDKREQIRLSLKLDHQKTKAALLNADRHYKTSHFNRSVYTRLNKSFVIQEYTPHFYSNTEICSVFWRINHTFMTASKISTCFHVLRNTNKFIFLLSPSHFYQKSTNVPRHTVDPVRVSWRGKPYTSTDQS